MIRLTTAALLACALFTSSARAETAQVNIDNFAFTPATITIAAGTKLTWANQDDIPHTVTEAAPTTFRSPPLDTDDTFEHVFDQPGTYRYFCSLHPHMQGTVIVK